MTAYLSTLVPPLWRKKITPKLLEWGSTQADKREFGLIREANNVSGWEELKQSIANNTADVRSVPQGNLGY